MVIGSENQFWCLREWPLKTGFTVIILFQAEQQLDCALDLMRRLPPQQIEKNLSDLIDVVSLIPGVIKLFNVLCPASLRCVFEQDTLILV